jgi:cytoskeleton-associated protein 5
MAPLRARQNSVQQQETRSETPTPPETPRTLKVNGHNRQPSASSHPDEPTDDDPTLVAKDEITITISSILSSDSSRSVDALKKIQKILDVSDESSHESAQYRDLANHTEGLIETITLQMAHIFDRPDDLSEQDNYRLAKHLIQTLNAFCDHAALAESLSVDILTSLLEELTVRLLQTDESKDGKVKDLSRFINMIILRLFGTGRRINVFRCVTSI